MDWPLRTKFMPSEVARLVLGYLKQERCEAAAECFLKESSHLAEYRTMLDAGFSAPLTIAGRGLTLILSYCTLDADDGDVSQSALWQSLEHILSQLKSSHSFIPRCDGVSKVTMLNPSHRPAKCTDGLFTVTSKQAFNTHRLLSDAQSANDRLVNSTAAREPFAVDSRHLDGECHIGGALFPLSDSIVTHSVNHPTGQEECFSTVDVKPLRCYNKEGSPVPAATKVIPDGNVSVVKIKGCNSIDSNAKNRLDKLSKRAIDPNKLGAHRGESYVEVITPIKAKSLKTTPANLIDKLISSNTADGGGHNHPVPSLTCHSNTTQAPAITIQTQASTMQEAPAMSCKDHAGDYGVVQPSDPNKAAYANAVCSFDDMPILSIPDDASWSPFKPAQSLDSIPNRKLTSSLLTPGKEELRIDDILPMDQVVEKLLHNEPWQQQFAESINKKKESSELTKEEVEAFESQEADKLLQEVLAMTKDDPLFSDFHLVLQEKDGSKRKKTKPSKAPAANEQGLSAAATLSADNTLSLPDPQPLQPRKQSSSTHQHIVPSKSDAVQSNKKITPSLHNSVHVPLKAKLLPANQAISFKQISMMVPVNLYPQGPSSVCSQQAAVTQLTSLPSNQQVLCTSAITAASQLIGSGPVYVTTLGCDNQRIRFTNISASGQPRSSLPTLAAKPPNSATPGRSTNSQSTVRPAVLGQESPKKTSPRKTNLLAKIEPVRGDSGACAALTSSSLTSTEQQPEATGNSVLTKIPPLAKNHETVVTAKWSPSLKNLIKRVSPHKKVKARDDTHVRHLRFSPRGVKKIVSPKRMKGLSPHVTELSPSVASPDMNSPKLIIVSTPGTPRELDSITTTSISALVGQGCDQNQDNTAVQSTAPSSRTGSVCTTPSTTIRPAGAANHSSPKPGAPPRRYPVAHKGARADSDSPSSQKRGSPSVHIQHAEHDGTISSLVSVTVGQSTPRGKNMMPVVIESPTLQRTISSLTGLDHPTAVSYNATDVCQGELSDHGNLLDDHASIQTVASTQLVPCASKQPLQTGNNVLSPTMTYRDNSRSGSHSETDVDVVQALMVLASQETPSKMTPAKNDVMQQSSPAEKCSRKRILQDESPGTSQAKKMKKVKAVRTRLKNMSLDAMLAMIHKTTTDCLEPHQPLI